MSRRYLAFVAKFVVVLVACTFLIGAVSYHLLTKKLLEHPNSALAAILRTPSQPELWRQAMIWVLPVQILRGVLIATVLYPFYDVLVGWSYWKRFGVLAGLLVVLGVLAGSYGVIETAYMTRPEFVTPEILLRTLPEPIVQGLAIAACLALWMPNVRKEGSETSPQSARDSARDSTQNVTSALDSPDVAAVQAFVEAVNGHDLAALSVLMTEDQTFVDSGGTTTSGRETMLAGWKAYFGMFPDYKIHVESLLADKALVAAFGSASGTYNGKRGLVAENRIAMPAAWMALVEDGKIKRWQVYADWTAGCRTIEEDKTTP